MKLVYVQKYNDMIPVQLRDADPEGHLEDLAQRHGEAAITLEDGTNLGALRQVERDRLEQEAAEAAEAERQRIEAEEAAKVEAERLAAEEAAKAGNQAPGSQ